MSDQERKPDTNPSDQAALEALTLIDDHEEEVISESGEKVRRRGIYLLPNLFTTGALFFGFFAVVSAIDGRYEAAAISIFVAMILDGLDGRVARLTNTQSKFGAEYDSLADMVSFGAAPALVAFSWSISELGKLGMAASFIYVACAALRLARFNTQIDTADKNFFTGLASPAAAAVVTATVWVCHDFGWAGQETPLVIQVGVAVMVALCGVLMILNVPYHSFKGFDLRGRVPFVALLAVVLVIVVVTVDPPRILLAIFLLYALSGPAMALKRICIKSDA